MTGMHEGGCLCGAVRYRVTGEPRTAFVCHCTFCQRSSGSAFQVLAFFPKGNVEFIGAAPSTYEHQSPIHGRMLRPQFCARCGSRVGMTAQRASDFQLICGGSFDDPNWFRVQAHIFIDSAVDWMTFPPDVRCYAQHFMTEAGAKEQPLPPQSKAWSKADLSIGGGVLP